MQQKYANYTNISLVDDLSSYVLTLKDLRSQISDKPRSNRKRIIIQILSELKTNADYKRCKYLISNARIPFNMIEGVNYDLDSDDSDNENAGKLFTIFN